MMGGRSSAADTTAAAAAAAAVAACTAGSRGILAYKRSSNWGLAGYYVSNGLLMYMHDAHACMPQCTNGAYPCGLGTTAT
jgi:hypothetical protein